LSGFFVLQHKFATAGNKGASIVSKNVEHKRNTASTSRSSTWGLSLDTWAVIVALVLSGAIWIGVIKHVPW
jgi:hypothetical protein